ncbi:isopenicillin N synthase family dioxygenase [Enemella sp. A6]|uniref:isopenicillin N synthase family dioxygenase n=1 Tax=Enemella sp. A6 TaxID=3440152 RepID=UPI003EC02AC0
MAEANLPVLDMSQLADGPESAAAFRAELRRATHEVGFFHLTGHGVDEDTISDLFALAQRFFDLPEADKLAIEMLHSPHFRGYTRTGGELTQGAVDWREQIDLGAEREVVPSGPGVPDYLRLEGPNQWPAALPELREVITGWSERMSAIGMRLMQEWAEALGADRHFFDHAFVEPSTLIKLVHYPGREGVASRQGVGPHKDPGVLTLLLIEPGKGGLQVERDGHWVDVPPVPGAFVVNIGELLEFATNGYLKATNHRVLSPAPGQSRLSIPFFFNPATDSTVPVLQLPDELAALAPGVTRDPNNPISGTFGENMLKARLRAHPDVAARHHPDLLARPVGTVSPQ